MSTPMIESVVAKIRAADVAYYNSGEAILEDAAYDALKDQLRALAPEHELLKTVGATASDMLSKVSHAIPMGSLNKAMNREEFFAWAKAAGGALLTASLKMDGGSVSLKYVKGVLTQAVTRGDGQVGEDITNNAIQFKGTPKRGVEIMGTAFTGYVRAEIMLLNEDWKRVDPDQLSNPRNLGNGIARRKDGEDADLLTVYAFRAHYEDGSEVAATEEEMSRALEAAGFNIASALTGAADEIWAFFEATQKSRQTLPFWIDGVTVKLNDIAEQHALGETDQRPKGQIAIKFEARGFPTILRSVKLTVGHTGAIIPTGLFDPVQIDGTSVSNALLCNWDLIETLDLAVGDSVLIYKAGDIIPRVMEVTFRPTDRAPIPRPTKCPVCGGPVGRKKSVHGEDSVALYCLNEDCPAQALGKIDRYIRSLDILGIGDEVLAALVSSAFVQTPADLYALCDIPRLPDLLLGAKGIRLGEKRAKKVLEAIEAKRELTVAEFLGSLGIEGLGKRRVALIQAAVPGQLDTITDWTEGKLAGLAEAAGVPNLGKRLSDAVVSKQKLIADFFSKGVRLKTAPKVFVAAGAKSFCFTGASSVPRKQLVAMAHGSGHIVKDDVGAGLDYLVMADPSSTSSKAAKARKLGTKCISEEEFRGLVETTAQ